MIRNQNIASGDINTQELQYRVETEEQKVAAAFQADETVPAPPAEY